MPTRNRTKRRIGGAGGNDPRREQQPHAYSNESIQTIPEPNEDNLLQVAEATKEAVETLAGERGDIRNMAVTFRDLEDAGLVTVRDINGDIQNNNIQDDINARVAPIRDIYLDTATSDLQVTDLTGIAHGGYRVEIEHYNARFTAGTPNLYWASYNLYLNNDFTNTNYRRQYQYTSGASITGQQGTDSYAGYSDKNGPVRITIDFSIVPNGAARYVYVEVITRGGYLTTSIPDRSVHHIVYIIDVAATDLTSFILRVSPTAQTLFNVGTRCRVWRKD